MTDLFVTSAVDPLSNSGRDYISEHGGTVGAFNKCLEHVLSVWLRPVAGHLAAALDSLHK